MKRKKGRTSSTTISWSKCLCCVPLVTYGSEISQLLFFTNGGTVGCRDYRGMGEQDQYEGLGIDDSLEDERDLDQIMADRRAAELELDTKEARVSQRKLPRLLHDQGLFYVIFSIPLF